MNQARLVKARALQALLPASRRDGPAPTLRPETCSGVPRPAPDVYRQACTKRCKNRLQQAAA
eukprot:11618858-Alexandrium_andersonii.AAC.1